MTAGHDRERPEPSAGFLAAYGITPREADVLGCVLAGKPNKAIADELCVSVKTVETHLGSIYRKTGAEGRLALFSLITRG
ncbi:MAG: helix-turn-helix domain-containing protein [Spirochaetota bacterium]